MIGVDTRDEDLNDGDSGAEEREEVIDSIGEFARGREKTSVRAS